MRARSWMAALALLGGTAIVVGRVGRSSAQAPSPTPEPTRVQNSKAQPAARARTDAPKPSRNSLPAVQLNLVIAGLGRGGCDVEVKPANPGCRFRVLSSQHVPSEGRAMVELRDVELRGADPLCTLAITVRERGQPPKTIYRGFRLATRAASPPGSSAPAASSEVPSVTCYLSSRLAGVESHRTRSRK